MDKLLTCPTCGSTAIYKTDDYNCCRACNTIWFSEKISAEDFKEKFTSKVDNLIHGSVKQMAVDKVKRSFTVTSTQKLFVATSLALVFGVRDRRNRHKIKELKKVVELLNLENDFLHTFVNGLVDPKANKEELLKTLGTQFQFLSLVKDI